MPEKRMPPDHPIAWLNSARSDLALALANVPGALLEGHCYHAQQAVEKALKAVMIDRDVFFPYTHNIAELLEILAENDIHLQVDPRIANRLTEYATVTRYPGLPEPVTNDEYLIAIDIAQRVVEWADGQIQRRD